VRQVRGQNRGRAEGNSGKNGGAKAKLADPQEQAQARPQPDAELLPTSDAAEAVVAGADPGHSPDAGADTRQGQGEPKADAAAAEATATDAPSLAANGEELPVLHAAPAHVASLLRPLIAAGRGVILASPSLAVAGDFEHVRGSLGLPEATRGVNLAADRAAQTLLCLPNDVPEPNAPHFQRSLEETLIALATALDGRLVAIFPSHAALRASYNGIRRALEVKDILVLAQGQDGSARQLWQHFSTQPRMVLLGAGVFWDGSPQQHPPACVVVTRLPFPALSDPLLAARADAWDDPQSQFVVPQAALKLRQALAGLAWGQPGSQSARNAVVLFDRRAQTRGYGATVLGTLPHCSQHKESVADLAERIAEWVGPA
jgi:Rad3-related DNA helicase